MALKQLRTTAVFRQDSVFLAIALALLLSVGCVRDSGAPPVPLSEERSPSEDAVGRQVALEGVNHVQEGRTITYKHIPPASGPHYDTTKPWGVYQEEMPEGYWLHNLEHGGIVILYNCPQGCPDLVEQLKDLYLKAPPSKGFGNVKLLISPYSKMKSKIAIVAWEWIDEMDGFDRERLLKFYKAHVDTGPESLAN